MGSVGADIPRMDVEPSKDLDKMDRPKIQGPGGTQMADMLIQNGVIEPDLVPLGDDAFHRRFQNDMKEVDWNEYKSIEQLEDEQVADNVLEKIRKQRREQLKLERAKKRFSGLREITEAEFDRECRETKDQVVLLLYSPVQPASDVISKCLESLANKFDEIKFLKLIGNRAIKNFSEEDCPTVMLYKNGEVQGQFAGAQAFAGLKTTQDVIEWDFAQLYFLETDLEEDPRIAKRSQFSSKTNFVRVKQTYRRGGDVSSDEDYFDESNDEEDD